MPLAVRCLAIVLAAGIAGLTACGTDVSSRNVESPAARDLFAGAAGGRDIAVDIVGNPFTVDREVLAKAVTDAMQDGHSGTPTRFTTHPSGNAQPGFRIVIAFNLPRGYADYRLCRDDAPRPPARPPSADLDIVMAFCGSPWLRAAFCRTSGWCRETGLISAVTGRAPMTAPGEAAFHRFLANLTHDLIPDAEGRLQSR